MVKEKYKKFNIGVKPDVKRALKKWAAEKDITIMALTDSILRERLGEVGVLE